MSDETVDAIILGVGPGGEAVANRLVDAGLSVIAIDDRLFGGECPYWACVPTKMMVRAAGALAEARRVNTLAGTATVEPDWAPVAARIRDEATDDWDDAAAIEKFEGRGGRFVRGRGRLTSPRSIDVDGHTFTAQRAVVIGTGTTPMVPPIDGLEGTPYWTNRDVAEATEAPASLIVLGGGPIGVELAQVFARFGTDIMIVQSNERLVPAEEPETSALLAEVFAGEGIAVHAGASATKVAHDGQRFTVTLADGTELAADRLLVATGRRTDLAGIGAEALGVDHDARFLDADEHLRVANGVWAVGDLTGTAAFTHVAMYQAKIAAADILSQPHEPADYHAIPRVTFTDPEIGSVGLTEAQARQQGLDVAVGSVPLADVSRGFIHGPGNEGLIKIVADQSRNRLVGATTMGPSGGEMIGALTRAGHAEIPLDRLRTMITPFPTFHRGIDNALAALADD